MKIAAVALKCKKFIGTFIQLQLFITLFSLPILIAWGIPFSLLSPLGNLFFGPFLSLFLFGSSLVFFSELLHMPNAYLITALEQFTSFWLTLMHANPQPWLIGFAKPSLLLLSTLIVIIMVIMLYRNTASTYTSSACFLALFCSFWFYSSYYARPVSLYAQQECNRGQLHIAMVDKQLIIIDPGYLGQKSSAPSWVQYTLIPYLLQQTGSMKIDYLILLRPNGTTFEAVELLLQKMQVRHIYLVCWKGDMKPYALRRYGALKRAALSHDTQWIRIDDRCKTIQLNGQNSVDVETVGTINYTTISYPLFKLTMRIDNKDIPIYSANYAKKNHTITRQKNNF